MFDGGVKCGAEEEAPAMSAKDKRKAEREVLDSVLLGAATEHYEMSGTDVGYAATRQRRLRRLRARVGERMRRRARRRRANVGKGSTSHVSGMRCGTWGLTGFRSLLGDWRFQSETIKNTE
eukprot:2638491-Rhodomonas_salina.1